MILTVNTPERSIEKEAEEGARLDDLVLSTGALLDRPCGGRSACGKCRVKAGGSLSDLTDEERRCLSAEEIEGGTRLACQTMVTGDAEVWIERGTVFTDKTFTTGVSPDDVPGPLGLAIDLGTTTVAAFLVELSSGGVLAGSAVLNRQSSRGAEVMSRLLAAESDAGKLKSLAWESVREAVDGLGLSRSALARVNKAMVVGNSAMHHLALGLSVDTLMREPFEPVSMEAAAVASEEIMRGSGHESEAVFAPLIGGFVGSDALACLMYFGLGRGDDSELLLDLGTNGEVMLASGGRIYAASTAAGPAFEGVNISCGVRAAPGAITGVRFSRDRGFSLDTVSGAKPSGLTGSGLLSALRCLRGLGVVEESGRIADQPISGVVIRVDNGMKVIDLAPGVWVTQQDIRELQKAKGAVRAAVEILLGRAGIAAPDLSRVILTGGFGGRIEPTDALELGVLPGVKAERILSIPNGAGLGAAMMLDPERFDEAKKLASTVKHVELNLEPRFMDLFVSCMILSGDGDDPRSITAREEYL